MDSPSAELWQSLVDSFVEIGDGVHDNWIMVGKYPDVEENREINAFLASLSESQRRVLTSMLIDARLAGCLMRWWSSRASRIQRRQVL
jgi:hypothetical protein